MSAARHARAAMAALIATSACTARDGAPSDRYGLGHAPSAAQIAALDISIDTSGAGLPPGSATALTGASVFAAKCASCHGAAGEGIGANPKLVGREPRQGFPFGRDVKLARTVGNYWPYATTVFDYVRRAMPLTAPGSLTNEEVYGAVAFLLAKNEIIADTTVVDARSLPRIRMPARAHFVIDDRRGGRTFK